jgi:nucleoside-diphosphate-sugar epimerase
MKCKIECLWIGGYHRILVNLAAMISILGCGWFGLPLGKALVEQGYKVKGSTTSALRSGELQCAGIRPYVVDLSPGDTIIDEGLFDCDVLIIAIPPKLRKGEYSEYLSKIQLIKDNIIKFNIRKVILISSTGVYLEVDRHVDESSNIDPDTPSSRTLLEAERLLMNDPDLQTTVVRFGGLIGPGRHPGRFFAGKKDIPNGQAPVNLIHLDDCIGIIKSIIEQDAFGDIFNACAPQHPQKQIFYTKAAANAALPAPHFIDELGDWKIVDSKNLSAILNYQFKFNSPEACFDSPHAF